MEPNTTPRTVADLQKKVDQLALEKNQYLNELSNGEILKMQLKETRKDAKHLSKQKHRLRAMADIEVSREETLGQSQVNSSSQPEKQLPSELNLSTSNEAFPELLPPGAFNSTPSKEESPSLHSQESFPPPPPHGFSMNGEISPTLPTAPFANVPREPNWGILDANAMRIENRDLVRIKRKQEEQIQNLVQEVATLETRCKELEGIAQRLEAENHRLSQQLSTAHVGQARDYNGPYEEIQLLRAQLKVYEDDFKKERSERENLNTQKERYKRELRESQASVAGLQRQLKQALAGEGGYAEPRDLPRGPIVNERYYDPYRVRLPLDYGMTRTYSGDYIGPGATSDLLRRGRAPYVKKAFLSPDMTAVVDDYDTTDGKPRAPKSI